jgi:sporulation protein YlmC with PRC-barrel domain
MEIPLNVDVHCSDGECGRSTAIILNPVTEEVTHFVVKASGLLGDEYLVPLDAIFESVSNSIRLRWSRDDFAQAEPFIKSVFIGKDESAFLAESMSATTFMWPYAMAGGDPYQPAMLAALYEQVEQIPPGELAVHRGTEVEAVDGYVGKVDEFLIDPLTGQITHLVLRKGHLWGERDITIPVAQIDRVATEAVYLKLDKNAVNDLPGITVHRQ